jgi:hypothetical protein
VQSDEARQHPRAAEVDGEPAAGEDLGEAGVIARDDQVATEREIQSCARRDADDLGDGRLLDRMQGQAHVSDVTHASETLSRDVGLATTQIAPEQNDPPAPVMTTTRSSSVLSLIARNVSRSSFHMTSLTAFFFSGRFNVTVTTPPARSTCSVSTRGTIIVAMGFNPFRQQRRSAADYAMVIAAVVVVALLVLWAFLG